MGFNGFFINKTQNPTQSPSESGFFPSLNSKYRAHLTPKNRSVSVPNPALANYYVFMDSYGIDLVHDVIFDNCPGTNSRART